jgi:hypothetical protein
MKHLTLLWAPLLSLCLVIGCADDGPTGTDDPDLTPKGPKVGTTYEYDSYELSSIGLQGPTVLVHDRLSVTSTTETYRGLSNVTTVVNVADFRIGYYHYADSTLLKLYLPSVSMPFSVEAPVGWVTYPLTGGTIHETVADTTYIGVSGGEETFHAEMTTTYEGTEEKIVKGESYTCSRISQRLEMTNIEEDGTGLKQINESTLWYSSELGTFVQTDSYSWFGSLANPPFFFGQRIKLVDFELK